MRKEHRTRGDEGEDISTRGGGDMEQQPYTILTVRTSQKYSLLHRHHHHYRVGGDDIVGEVPMAEVLVVVNVRRRLLLLLLPISVARPIVFVVVLLVVAPDAFPHPPAGVPILPIQVVPPPVVVVAVAEHGYSNH